MLKALAAVLAVVHLVPPSNTQLVKDPPILRLPVELALIIFDHCSSDVKARLSLAHTCQHWMSIMSKASSLWTEIRILVKHPAGSRQFGNLISLLEMQLDRAAGKPLSVVWESDQTSAFDPRLMNLLRRKGPFSQWRTLQIQFRAVHPDDANIFHPGDAFTNLESIVILPSVITSIIGILNLTTTSKLQALDYRPARSSNVVTLSHCTDVIGRITHLTTSNFRIGRLSSNITQLDTSYQTSHPFPHLKTYNIKGCIFESFSSIELVCLETLNATTLLLLRGAKVSLPALRHLTCRTIHFEGYTKISTPRLESMHVSGRLGFANAATIRTGEAIKNENFLFSPSHSLTVEPELPFDCILKLLERSPRLERVFLGFGDGECAIQILESIGRATSGDGLAETWLCGQLKELRLSFVWDKCEVESWKERAARVVNMRMRSGIVLRIYGTWKGEGTYVLLA